MDAATLLKFLQQKKTEALFFEIDKGIQPLASKIESTFKKYEQLSSKQTCLAPVKDFFIEHTSVTANKVEFVYNLLEELYSLNLIRSVSGININGSFVELQKYSRADVDKYLASLTKNYYA